MEMKKNWTERGAYKNLLCRSATANRLQFLNNRFPRWKDLLFISPCQDRLLGPYASRNYIWWITIKFTSIHIPPSRRGSVNIILIPGFRIMLWSTLRNHPHGEGSADPLALNTMLRFLWARCSEVSPVPFYGSETSSRVHPVQPVHHHYRSMSHYITTVTKVL